MKRMKIATVLAALLLVAGCTAAAQDTATDKTAATAYGPGWRHEQMMQARAQGQAPLSMTAQRGPGAGMGWGMGVRAMGGPPLNADGTIDTAQLPVWCPMRNAVPQK